MDPSSVDAEKYKDLQKFYQNQTRYAFRPDDIPAKETSIILFPGQGSQYVGMGKALADNPQAQEIYDIASGILGYDLLDMCLNGNPSNLNKTVHSQHAILVSSLAALEVLRALNPEAITNCISTAGYDVGELAALVLAGSISLFDAIHIVKKRAEFMQKCSETVPSGMMGVILGHKNRVNYALSMARLYCQKNEHLQMDRPVCSVAVDLYTQAKIIAGHEDCLDFVEREAGDFGIERTIRIPVSGAFHTALMGHARLRLAQALKDIEIKKPQIPVYSNVTCRPFGSARETRELIAYQISERVKWEQIMHILTPRPKDDDFPQLYGVGPCRQLGEMLKNTNKRAFTEAFKAVEC